MFSTHKTQRAFRLPLKVMHARAHDKEISFALVPMEEAKAAGSAGAAGRAGRRSGPRST
jgi:hypothetical protein